jgi:hypothetical protein
MLSHVTFFCFPKPQVSTQWKLLWRGQHRISTKCGKYKGRKIQTIFIAPCYNRSVHRLHLPRPLLELEFLISGYGCLGDGRRTHFGVNKSGSPEHTVYWRLNL